MPVTTTTNTQPFDTGFRAWVTVSNAAQLKATNDTFDVQLRWDSAKVDYVMADPNTPTPPFVSPALGQATWSNMTIPTGSSQDFGVILQCKDGVTETVNITGIAVGQGGGNRDSDTATWNCGTGGPG